MRQRGSSRDLPAGGVSPRGRKAEEGSSSAAFWVLAVCTLVLGVFATHIYLQRRDMQAQIVILKTSNAKYVEESKDTVEKMSKRIEELVLLKDKLEHTVEAEKIEKDQMQHRVESFERKVKQVDLEKEKMFGEATEKLARERDKSSEQERKFAEQRWGTSKVYIDFETIYGTFRMEMAPFALMPHSTSWFLHLAETGYWTGCGFVRNADHVMQANCDPKQGEEANKEDFQILFQEYSSQFPHEKYTFGIAGRPGGPDWYINLKDNTKNHGPGGQGPEADPCIGRLVAGDDVIVKMHQQARKSDSFQGLITNILFKSVKVVREDQENEEFFKKRAAMQKPEEGDSSGRPPPPDNPDDLEKTS